MPAATKIFLADLSHTHMVSETELVVPLNIGYVKAYADANLGDTVDIRLFKQPQKLLDALMVVRPEIVGLSNYSWNTSLNRHIGSAVREALPEVLIVGGGPNIDDERPRRKAFLEKHDYLDFLVVDGGEEPFAELIEWWRAGTRDKATLPHNLVWLEDGEVRETPLRELKRNIDNIVSPYLTGCLDEFLDAGMVPLFETNRGCPFKCSFCAWGAASKDVLRRMDFDVAMAEFEYVAERSKARNWVLCDANFGILKRDIEIAKKIRSLRDTKGRPQNVQTFLAKNVTDRNLAIGELLNDMTTATMSFQSLDPHVLENIERDNISLDTYTAYQKRFFDMKHRTYSELIVPLPGETPETHVAALKTLIDSGVHELHVHNLRMLAGTKVNSSESWEKFGFRSRYRLIHGDAGIYRYPSGKEGRIFEYEESLRETSTMSEADLFYFRKLQFFIEFSWNIEVYGPLLKIAHLYGIHPIDVLMKVLDKHQRRDAHSQAEQRCIEFMDRIQKISEEEWFDSEEDIEGYFGKEEDFKRLLNMEFDKLNILGAVILLREYKRDFDRLIKSIIETSGGIPKDVLDYAADFTFKRFPPLDSETSEFLLELPSNIGDLGPGCIDDFKVADERRILRLFEGTKRRDMRSVLDRARSTTLSKIINTQRFYLRNLKLSIDSEGSFALPFLFCAE